MALRVSAEAALLGVALIAISGCASVFPDPATTARPQAARSLEPSPELDFLIARQLELEGRLAESLAIRTTSLSRSLEVAR